MIYAIYDTRTGQPVAELEITPGQPPVLRCDQAPVRAQLAKFIGRDLLTVDDPDSFGDPVDEGAMCYLGQRAIAPTDPAYPTVLARQLPLLTWYELREA